MDRSSLSLRAVALGMPKTSQAVVLPSAHGNTGAVSTSPVGTSLFATYADYSSADPSNQAAGTRLFLEVTCR